MKYLCMIFFDEKKLDALSKEDHKALVDESLAYDDVLRKSGHLLANQALQPVHAATALSGHGAANWRLSTARSRRPKSRSGGSS